MLQTGPGLPGCLSLGSLDPRAHSGSEEVQRVDPHVAGEQHIEAAEPEQLAAVAGHGSLGGQEEWFWSWYLACAVSICLLPPAHSEPQRDLASPVTFEIPCTGL